MSDDLSLERQRLLLDLDSIADINNALKVLDYDTRQPLERLHGTVCIEIIKGQISYVKPAPSIPTRQSSRKQRKTA